MNQACTSVSEIRLRIPTIGDLLHRNLSRQFHVQDDNFYAK